MYVFYDKRLNSVCKYMTVWEKVNNIIKKILVNLYTTENI